MIYIVIRSSNKCGGQFLFIQVQRNTVRLKFQGFASCSVILKDFNIFIYSFLFVISLMCFALCFFCLSPRKVVVFLCRFDLDLDSSVKKSVDKSRIHCGNSNVRPFK